MKPSIPKGTRDFLPQDVYRQQYIFSTIRSVFEQFGYLPIETPVMENLETLLGKYGDEGDKLLFKVLNNGDFLAQANEEALEKRDSQKLVSSISKRGLRYDLTVPFARYVVMHQHEIQFPFKRYQIQPVWRADRPQKGRYQEFYQCDADIVGSDSLMYEAEYILMMDEVFSRFGLQVDIRFNHRKILEGLSEVSGIGSSQLTAMTVAIDKLDKIGWDGVLKELSESGIGAEASKKLKNLFEESPSDSGTQQLDLLDTMLSASESGSMGVKEVREVLHFLKNIPLRQNLVFDPTLARGLSYYTGCIFEARSREVKIGSILGGGRYANLTGVFGMPGLSGVGISFGVARIFDVLEELRKFPPHIDQQSQFMVVALDENSHKYAFGLLHQLHKSGLKGHLYPEPAKLKKQLRYADALRIPLVIIVGEQEIQEERFGVKHMASGEQVTLPLPELIEYIHSS